MAVAQPPASWNPLTNRGGPHRREFLRFGLAGFGALTWADLLRRRAEAATAPGRDTALLVVWLHGGASHLETYDPKPAAPAEYRGPYGAIPTSVPGMHLSELLPGHAKVARRFTLLRSLAHTGPCHDSGPQQLFTGFPITVNRLKPEHPDLFAVVDRLRADLHLHLQRAGADDREGERLGDVGLRLRPPGADAVVHGGRRGLAPADRLRL
jgi:hypothetical protein